MLAVTINANVAMYATWSAVATNCVAMARGGDAFSIVARTLADALSCRTKIRVWTLLSEAWWRRQRAPLLKRCHSWRNRASKISRSYLNLLPI